MLNSGLDVMVKSIDKEIHFYRYQSNTLIPRSPSLCLFSIAPIHGWTPAPLLLPGRLKANNNHNRNNKNALHNPHSIQKIPLLSLSLSRVWSFPKLCTSGPPLYPTTNHLDCIYEDGTTSSIPLLLNWRWPPKTKLTDSGCIHQSTISHPIPYKFRQIPLMMSIWVGRSDCWKSIRK